MLFNTFYLRKLNLIISLLTCVCFETEVQAHRREIFLRQSNVYAACKQARSPLDSGKKIKSLGTEARFKVRI